MMQKRAESNLFLLILTGVLIVVIIVFAFKANGKMYGSEFINNVVGILTIILTGLILIGFQLILNVNSAVERWERELITMNQKYIDMKEKVEEIYEEFTFITTLKNTWLIDNSSEIFKNITDGYAHVYELLSHNRFSNANVVIDAFHQSWVFSQNAADMFRPIIDEDRDTLGESLLAVLKAIDFICNQKTKASCRILWARIKVSDKILRYLEDTLEDIHKKMGENRRNVNCDELDLIREKISYEQKIREKLNYCYFSNCYP